MDYTTLKMDFKLDGTSTNVEGKQESEESDTNTLSTKEINIKLQQEEKNKVKIRNNFKNEIFRRNTMSDLYIFWEQIKSEVTEQYGNCVTKRIDLREGPLKKALYDELLKGIKFVSTNCENA